MAPPPGPGKGKYRGGVSGGVRSSSAEVDRGLAGCALLVGARSAVAVWKSPAERISKLVSRPCKGTFRKTSTLELLLRTFCTTFHGFVRDFIVANSSRHVSHVH